ncbi:DUF6221 family protein [Streptomyces nigrescens]
MTEALVAFLRARLDEEEVAAHTAPAGPWHADGDSVYASHPADLVVEYAYNDGAEHIARHDPARVLAEIEAKRAIVDQYAEVQEMDREDAEPEFAYGRAVGLGEAVRLLALPYQEHPDYRPEWRP